MTTIACVLKSGGIYGPQHVARLRAMLDQHAHGCELICLTDDRAAAAIPGVSVVPIKHGWPGWWSKIELMVACPGPLLYLDLDLTVVRPLAPLLTACRDHPFVISRDFWDINPHQINSSIMWWQGDALEHVYRTFSHDPARNMAAYAFGDRWGDQGFLRDNYRGGEWVYFQDLLPGSVMSYKREIMDGEDASKVAVVVYHGRPKPWDKGVDEHYAGPALD